MPGHILAQGLPCSVLSGHRLLGPDLYGKMDARGCSEASSGRKSTAAGLKRPPAGKVKKQSTLKVSRKAQRGDTEAGADIELTPSKGAKKKKRSAASEVRTVGKKDEVQCPGCTARKSDPMVRWLEAVEPDGELLRVGAACFRCYWAWFKVGRNEIAFLAWCEERCTNPAFKTETDKDREMVDVVFVAGPWDQSLLDVIDCGLRISQNFIMVKPARLEAKLKPLAPFDVGRFPMPVPFYIF